MGKDVGGEGNRRGEGSQISAGRAYTTEIDIEILGLDRPTVHQGVFAADASFWRSLRTTPQRFSADLRAQAV